MAERKAPRKQTTPDPESEAWNTLPWRKLEQHVYRIQKNIYQARKRGNERAVQKLQKLLMKSEAARLLAVRRVTQDNQGKNTAGVDGVKSVPPKERMILAETIHPKNWKRQRSQPVRRVWIPKPGKPNERRPLGIPTMLDRSKQSLAKMVLEPEWEAVFESNSYGFRPGRSCADAIGAIFNAIRYQPKYVFDADIAGCFDNINQRTLVKKLHTYPALSQAVKAWLHAGILDGVEWSPTERGTPQGGPLSPLLANVALHGMEEIVKEGFSSKRAERPILIRYADDFVLFHSNEEKLQKAVETVKRHLGDMGLELKPSKTRWTHTLTPYQGEVGFDFLGFHVQQYPVGKNRTGKSTQGRKLGFKTIITPSKEAIKRHLLDLKQRLRKARSLSQEQLLDQLNPVIRGWTRYYRAVVSSKTFATCDFILYYQLEQWARHKHRTRGEWWIHRKYWRKDQTRNWVFATPEGREIWTHTKTSIQRHAKVKGEASPYDGNLLYWSQRLRNHPLLRGTLARLLQKQQGRCRWCELLFRPGDLIEIDHITPKSEGGGEELSNKLALHRHCHDARHARRATPSIDDNDRTLSS